MTHFHTEKWTLGELLDEYPHDPADPALSFAEYLEAKLVEGYEFIGTTGWYGGTGYAVFLFRVVAK